EGDGDGDRRESRDATADTRDRLARIERAFGLPEAARGYDVLVRPEGLRPAPSDAGDPGSGLRERSSLTLRPGSIDDLVDYLQLVVVEHAAPGDLRRFDLFRGLDDSALTQAQEDIEWRMVARGEQLIRAGDPSDGLYLVELGRLQASVVTSSGERVTLSESGAYEVVGDTGLILESPRTADVHAKRDSRVGFLSAESFQRLQSFIPQLGRNAARIASRRTLVPTDALTRPAPSNLMLLSLDPGERSEALVRALERCLRDSLGYTVMLLTRAIVEEHLGPDATERAPGEPGYRQLLAWLNRVSLDHEIVIYACDASERGWARCCASHADRLLLLGAAGRDPGLRRIERELDLGDTPIDLVLLQPGGITRAAGTRAWLRERKCEQVHHVRDGAPGDLAAAARRIMVRANGIAFSGAVTRAPAHCGVARALETLSIPVDITAGTSSGSVIAGGLAAGIDHRALREITADLTVRARVRVTELQPPLTALTSGKKMDEVYQGIFGDMELEDLMIPCRLSTLDILTHELLYLGQGPLWRAARASCSLPVIYPPVTIDGRFLVDGGIVSYIPVNAILPVCHHGLAVMSDIGDPTPFELLRSTEPYGTQMSGWSQLADRLLPWRTAKARPGILDVIFLSMITSNHFADDRLATTTKHPAVCHVYQPLPGYGMFEVTPDVAREFEEKTFQRAYADLTAWLDRRTSSRGE
ncbi:MAG: cyclic nucleotide-binding and patatin-like phospholipase domain-containing protein, partial [Nannocystaceae bacterium]